MKTTLSVLMVIIALGISPAAQTLAEQLERGIYTEETLKNKDEAVRIYRQILAAPTVPEAISSEAQRRLARLLVTAVPAKPPAAASGTTAPRPLGVVEHGRYRHLSSGITFDLSPGWSASSTFPSSDDGDMVTLTDGTYAINVWMIKEATPADQVMARVAAAPADKVQQRHSGYSISADAGSYEIPADTLRPGTINGKHAITAIGSYIGGSNRPMREYMTWIYTQNSRIFFFARVSPDEVPLLRPMFEQIVNSAIVP
jgi:hypothetical protein